MTKYVTITNYPIKFTPVNDKTQTKDAEDDKKLY